MSDLTARQATDLADLLDVIEDLRSGWRKQGACRAPDVDPALFSPRGGQVPTAARVVCAGCPVVADCARFGATQKDPAFAVGTVWAGEFPNQLAEWRDADSPEWRGLMSGQTRITRGMTRRKTSDAAA